MKFIKAALLFSLTFIMLMSCKKEGPEGPAGPAGPTGPTTAVNPAIYGKWQVTSGLPNTKYIILKSNNNIYRLDSAAYGFKSLLSDMALLTYTQINAFFVTYNYSITNNTLTLSNLNGTIVLTKNDNAPDETEWVTTLNITDSIASPTGGDGRQDIGFDGTDILWTSTSSSNILYKINPVTHAVTNFNLSSSYYYGCTNYSAGFLWISDGNTIDKVNATSGAVLSTSPVLSSIQITADALIGQDMWYCNWNGDVYTWNISTNVITPQFGLSVSGMEYTGGFLYLFHNHMIYKCQLSPFEAITTYYIQSENVSGNNGGLTFDGANFWVVGYHNNTGEHKLYRLGI
ncbi:MAG TPA: hypothetical protein PKN48_09265 [Bacteroidales bacterium]|nr:hypothetical protein [Bacteroidales bacterium]